MPAMGNKDYSTGNNKPLYANTSNAYSNSVINGNQATLIPIMVMSWVFLQQKLLPR
jgi:hypothetical protein